VVSRFKRVAELFDHELEVVNVGRRRDGKGGL
jgi:hypothetical protein